MQSGLTRRVVAELLGTFAFVLVGAGSAIGVQALGVSDPASSLAVAALANGLGLGVAITATMAVSGGSLNPAVTLALFVARKLPVRDVVPYIVAELAGGALAVLALVVGIPTSVGNAVRWGAPGLAPEIGVSQGIFIEFLMTVVLIFAVFGTAVSRDAPKVGGFGIGIAVLVDVLFGGAFTGAAMNPARAMGPMLAALKFPSYWYVYWVGPLLASLVAGGFYRYFLEGGPDEDTR